MFLAGQEIAIESKECGAAPEARLLLAALVLARVVRRFFPLTPIRAGQGRGPTPLPSQEPL
jgi:hypothetical protein